MLKVIKLCSVHKLPEEEIYPVMFFTERWKLFSVIVYYRFQSVVFPELAAVAETLLQDTHFMSILSKRSSQASGDSFMYMSDRHIRQWAINEDNGIFSVICFHIALRKVQTSALNFFSWTLVILPLLFTCCMSYFRENSMPILLLKTLFSCFDMSISNNFNVVFAPSKISAKQTCHRIVLARTWMRNGAMGLPVWNITKRKMYFLGYFKYILRHWNNFFILGRGWSMFVHETKSAGDAVGSTFRSRMHV